MIWSISTKMQMLTDVAPPWAIIYQKLKSCNITVPTLSSSMCRKSIFGFNYFSAHKHTAIHHSRRLLCRALCQHQVGHNWGLCSKIWDGFSPFLFWQTYCKFTIFWAGSVHWILRLQIIRSRLQHKFWQKSVSCYQAKPNSRNLDALLALGFIIFMRIYMIVLLKNHKGVKVWPVRLRTQFLMSRV